MEANYQLVRNADIQQTNQKSPLHARIVPHETLSIMSMMEYADSFSSLSKADVVGALQLISDLMAQALRDGYNVELDGIGYFSVSLECRPVMEKEEIRAESVHFRNVNFRLSKQMKQRLKTMPLKRTPKAKKESYTEAERMERLRSHLAQKHYITTRTYMGLNGCTKYTALKDLKQLVISGELIAAGTKGSTIYLKGE